METSQFHTPQGPLEITLANMSAADILLRCSCVCKRWNQIIGGSMDLWQSLLIRDYKNKNNSGNKKGDINQPLSGALKQEYINLYKRVIQRENMVEKCVKAFPLFGVDMLEASIIGNIGNLNRPRMNLESLLMMSQSHLSDWWYSPRLIHLHRPAIILLSHVLSRFCAELLYDAGIIAMGAKEINSDCIRVIIQGSPFFASSILSAMVGSPIRIHAQNINNILNTLRWEGIDGEGEAQKISRQGLALAISFVGDTAAQIVHSSISFSRKRGEEIVSRFVMLDTIRTMFPPSFVFSINRSIY